MGEAVGEVSTISNTTDLSSREESVASVNL